MVGSREVTTAALLTPPAPGAIAEIALAGPKASEILTRIVRHPRRDEPANLKVDVPALCRILDEGQFIDDAIVALLSRPGGPMAEICTHGGVRIAQRMLMLLQKHGAQIIDADEFLARQGTSDPIELDVDRALLKSTSRRLTIWLLHQRRILPPFMAHPPQLDTDAHLELVGRSMAAIRIVEQGVSVAIVGPPNAGKSTLANRLIGHDRIITSSMPGTTRDWVSETAVIRGWPVTLTDTAGIRESDCEIESEAIRRGADEAQEADLTLIVLDASTDRNVQNGDLLKVIEVLPEDATRVLVFNKRDLVPDVKVASHSEALLVSAVTGHGMDELEQRIAYDLNLDRLRDDLPTPFTREQLLQIERTHCDD